MRLPGVNRKQNDLQNQFNSTSTYVTSTNRELTRDEMISRLISRKTSVYDLSKYNMIDVLTNFNDKRTELSNKLYFIDQKGKTSYSENFDLVLPSSMTNNAIRKLPVRQIATLLLNLAYLLDSVKEFPQIRHVRDLIDPTLKIMNELKLVVLEEREDVEEPNVTMRGIKLNYEARSTSYLCGGGLLPEPEFRACSFCNHTMVDEPLSNQSVVAENNIILRDYESNLKFFTLHKEGKGPPLKKHGKIVNRLIKQPGKCMLLQCHCFQMQCTRKDSDSGSTCFNKCLDKNGKRSAWLDGKGCSCIICNCNCNKKYKKQDAVKISAEIKRRENVNSNSLICDMPANEQAVAQKFIGDSFMMGAQVAQTAQDHLNSMKRKGM